MKKKIVVIIIGIFLIMTALPAVEAINTVEKVAENEQEPPCGTCLVVIDGPDSQLAGAKVGFYQIPIGWTYEYPIKQTNPEEDYYGKYLCVFLGCGTYQAKVYPNDESKYKSTSQWFTLQDENYVIIFLTVSPKSKCRLVNEDETSPPCGTCLTVVSGSDNSLAGAQVGYYQIPFGWTFETLYKQTNPEEDYYGDFLCVFQGCGTYKATIYSNDGKQYGTQWFTLQDENYVIIFLKEKHARNLNLLINFLPNYLQSMIYTLLIR